MTAIEKDLRDDMPRTVHGRKGINAKPFIKKFKNEKEMDKWLDKTEEEDYTIDYIQRL